MVLTNIPVMKKIMYILIISVLALSHLQAQKLTGTIIGTSDNFDYTTYSCSRAVNTPPNVFDGNLNTFLAGCNRSYVWAGLDLGEPHVITEIAYCPRVEMQERLVLGVFEGANNPDFGDAIPIFVITQKPADKTLTRQAISCSRAFRYVRYVGPDNSRGNIAEVEFYGFKSSGDDSKLYQTTNLPSVIIHTADAQDVVVKELYIKGIVSVVSENGTEIYTDSLEIKGRGNASWDFPKKPYRLKLNNKANLLGMPAREKNWTLISNYGDKTLMRNLLAFDLSQRLEMPYTPAGKPVDVFLNTTPFHADVAVRSRRQQFNGADVPFLSCTDLAVFKAFFNRTKDWADLEEMAVAGTLDRQRVVGVLAEYLGLDDPRVGRVLALPPEE